MSSICPTCKKRVYFAERVSAAGKDYHKLCFKCANCKKRLEPGKFSEREQVLYCKQCYGQLFGEKGYGFGGGSGTLSSYVASSHPAPSSVDSRPIIEQQTAPAASSSPAAASGGAKFCSNCGTKVEGMKFCPNCGTPNK